MNIIARTKTADAAQLDGVGTPSTLGRWALKLSDIIRKSQQF
jgi:hypothetical protein